MWKKNMILWNIMSCSYFWLLIFCFFPGKSNFQGFFRIHYFHCKMLISNCIIILFRHGEFKYKIKIENVYIYIVIKLCMDLWIWFMIFLMLTTVNLDLECVTDMLLEAGWNRKSSMWNTYSRNRRHVLIYFQGKLCETFWYGSASM